LSILTRARPEGPPTVPAHARLNAQFLALEDGRNLMHVSALAIFDPGGHPQSRLTPEEIQGIHP
jgi:hypothetical protein